MRPYSLFLALAVTTGLNSAASVETAAPELAARVATLSRVTPWTRIATIPLQFRTFHPQGLIKVGANFFVSAVEIRTLPRKLSTPIDGHDYDAGSGVGHLFKVASDGTLLAHRVLGEGPIYHPGGMDFDGQSIWVPVAEYRPDSRSIVYRVNPVTMESTVVFRVADHVGGVVHDAARARIVGLTWGSRRFLTWPIEADGATTSGAGTAVANRESYVDYQDCHKVDARHMLCAGVAEYQLAPGKPPFSLGGVDLIDLATFSPVWQTPIALWSPTGRAMTQNPFWMEATQTGVRAWFLPDDDVSILYVYDGMSPLPVVGEP